MSDLDKIHTELMLEMRKHIDPNSREANEAANALSLELHRYRALADSVDRGASQTFIEDTRAIAAALISKPNYYPRNLEEDVRAYIQMLNEARQNG